MDTVTASATVVLVVITGFYAYVTYRMWRVNEKVVLLMGAQSNELTHQVKLSIMPALSIEYVRVHGASEGQHLERMYDLVLRNVGNGIATQIRAEPVTVRCKEFHPDRQFADGTIAFKWVASLRPGAAERLSYFEEQNGRLHDVELMRFLQQYAAGGEPVQLQFRFNDIEGTEYSQGLRLMHNECYLDPVKSLP